MVSFACWGLPPTAPHRPCTVVDAFLAPKPADSAFLPHGNVALQHVHPRLAEKTKRSVCAQSRTGQECCDRRAAHRTIAAGLGRMAGAGDDD